MAGIDAGQELTHLELIRPDAFERIECPTEHVIATVELPRPFHRHDVPGIFHHAENGVRPLSIAADSAQISALGHVETLLAQGRPLFHRDDGIGESAGILGRHLQDMKRDALG